MYNNKTRLFILEEILDYYPDAKAELNYESAFQFLIAVMLSAQTTDVNVNKVTDVLFNKYPTAKQLKDVEVEEVEDIIRSLGMYKAKAANVIQIAKTYDEKFDNKLPTSRDKLISLPGVGMKTANVVLATLTGAPYMAVDTHINRVCQRLSIVPINSEPDKTARILEKILKNEDINQYHHSILFFGRYHCKAKKPLCEDCTLTKCCKYNGGRQLKRI